MPVPVIIGVGAVAAATLAWWKAKQPTDDSGETPDPEGPPPDDLVEEPAMPNIQNDWSELFEELHGDVDVNFLQRWIANESNGGNPCAVGSVAQLRSQGFAREAGIGQLYFETATTTRFGVTSSDLRSACSTTDETAVRELTDDEKRLQVNSLVAMAASFIAIANQRLGAANLSWSDTEVLALAKLQHALPALSKTVLPAAVAAGQAENWASFRNFVIGLTADEMNAIDRGVTPYIKDPGMPKLFNNAERTAGIQ